MAGEVKGKIYEAITKVALDVAVKNTNRKLTVFWHEQPSWVKVESDLAVGKDINAIEASFLVTHSTAEKDSKMKFLRNISELFQWKVQGPSSVACYSVIFDAAIKPELMKISQSVIDAELIIQDLPYGQALIRYVDEHENEFENSDEQREVRILNLINPRK